MNSANGDANGFSSAQVGALVGVSEGQITKWARDGIIRPSIRPIKQGTGALWSERDVADIRAVIALRRVLWSLASEPMLAGAIKVRSDAARANLMVAFSEKGAMIARRGQALSEISRRIGPFFVVCSPEISTP